MTNSVRPPLHQRKRSKASRSDEYETPKELFDFLCKEYDFYPGLDVCATSSNSKCNLYLTKHDNALKASWRVIVKRKQVRVWCNPPHTETEEFVEAAFKEFVWSSVETMMIIPANSMCTKYAKKYIRGSAYYEPIYFRPTFLVDGKKSKFNARNGYFVVIWRRR